MRVIAHGGAGADGGADRLATLEAATRAGVAESRPLDAVETTLGRLESSPQFNAGLGGAVQDDGVVRTDAGVMTSDRSVGAVCSTPGVEHAVSAARVVMEETPHVLVVGDHAADLAAAYGIETGRDLLTDETRRRYAAADPPDGTTRERLAWVRERFGGFDTVGAVAADGGQFAAGTSTAGRWFALAGRVGDVPQVGSGFYCTPAGGASATGVGEDIARVTLARRAVDHLESGHPAAVAAERAIDTFTDVTGSEAGLIVLGPDGTGQAHDSEGMQTAVATR